MFFLAENDVNRAVMWIIRAFLMWFRSLKQLRAVLNRAFSVKIDPESLSVRNAG